MYIIIAGCGMIGATLALSFSQDNHNVAVVESDPDNLSVLGSGFNGLTVVGQPIDEDVLRNAGAEQADALLAITEDDNMNIMVSQVAKELFHIPKIITRLFDSERESIFCRMGMATFCSTTLSVAAIRQMLFPEESAMSFGILGTGHAAWLRKPPKGTIGKTIPDCTDLNILAILRDQNVLTANANAAIEPLDILLVCDKEEESP